MPQKKIRSVVIPAAGRGTRLLPATKTTPKELLNVYDRPVIQFAIDEAVNLGADRIIVVLHPDKRGIREYLAPANGLATFLRESGKVSLAQSLEDLDVPARVEIVFAEQSEPLGLGHAVLCAKESVLPGPFAVILPDDLIFGPPCLTEMAARYTQGHMIAAMEVSAAETSSYGIFTLAGLSIGRSVPVLGMVEKPSAGLAPSRLAAVGRYILEPTIFDTLAQGIPGAGGEIQLTDALERDSGRLPLTAYKFSGVRYDCGAHDGLMDASLAQQTRVKQRLVSAIQAEQVT